jgi:hypothetical protein
LSSRESTFAHYLKHEVDLSDFNAKERAGMTEGKARAIEAAEDTRLTWLRDQIDSRKEIFGRDVVQSSDIIKAARDFGIKLDTTFLHNALPQLGGGYPSSSLVGRRMRSLRHLGLDLAGTFQVYSACLS